MAEREFIYDDNNDGIMDSYADEFDLNEDDRNDARGIDRDGDGDYEVITADTDYDGNPDMVFADDDNDGNFELLTADTNKDGELDFALDDTDGDGDFDVLYQDTNHDGNVDYIAEDTDGNGEFDNIELLDTDEDGNYDVIREDLDGDGIFETVREDTDHDGRWDVLTSWGEDEDGDGYSDSGTQERYEDTDGDGEFDKVTIFQYDKGDEVFEVLEICDLTEESEMPEEEVQEEEFVEVFPIFVDREENGVYYSELEHFDPETEGDDKIIGDPGAAMEYWDYQNYSGPCGLYAQKFIIEEMTGQEVDIDEMIAIAEENGWYNGSTSLVNQEKMLEYYGLECRNTCYNPRTPEERFPDIVECLENGGRVIVSIDADELWRGEHDFRGETWSDDEEPVWTPGEDKSNHAVEVIGIDYRNSEEPMIILNDSGSQNGCGIMVPYSAFMDAWEDSNAHMVTCYRSEE